MRMGGSLIPILRSMTLSLSSLSRNDFENFLKTSEKIISTISQLLEILLYMARKVSRMEKERGAFFEARVQIVCNPLTKPAFVPKTLIVGRKGPTGASFTPLEGNFSRATNPRTGNDWQPFRSRLGLGNNSTRVESLPPLSISPRPFFPSSFISFPFLFFFRAPYEDKRENRLSPLYPSINPVHRIIEGPRLYRNVEKGEIGDEVEIFEGGKGVSQESKPSETFRGRKIKRECKRSFQDGVSLNFRERIDSLFFF